MDHSVRSPQVNAGVWWFLADSATVEMNLFSGHG